MFNIKCQITQCLSNQISAPCFGIGYFCPVPKERRKNKVRTATNLHFLQKCRIYGNEEAVAQLFQGDLELPLALYFDYVAS